MLLIQKIINYFKKKDKKASIIVFLNKADEAYILAHKSKDIRYFIPYCTPKLSYKIDEKIQKGEEILFGISKYRIRDWDIKEGDKVCVAYKSLNHESIKLTKDIKIAVGDRLEEEWLIKNGDDYIIVDIKERG